MPAGFNPYAFGDPRSSNHTVRVQHGIAILGNGIMDLRAAANRALQNGNERKYARLMRRIDAILNLAQSRGIDVSGL